MPFRRNVYRRAVEQYCRCWQTTDRKLYALCRQYPGHDDEAGVNAKLWLIGRTYATGIERQITADGRQGGSMRRLSRLLLRRHRRLDRLFSELRLVRQPLTETKLETIIDVHRRFMALVQPVVRADESPRSFCSKYMHFHCPAVPIFDSRAESACRSVVPWQADFWLFDPPAGTDRTFARYVFRFWELYKQARAAEVEPTVRHLDYYLLIAGGEIG